MDFDHDNVRLRSVNEDRLSSLPDELIHQILSFIDTKSVVQTCLLSSRWKHIWKSVPCLSFSRHDFAHEAKSAKFVTSVLSHRNNLVEVSSVKLNYGFAGQVLMRKLANYAFSHNVQELNIISSPKNERAFPPCLFSSRTLEHFTLETNFSNYCYAPKTPWDFPALTSLHLSELKLCASYRESVDLFSKCVNLENLTLIRVTAMASVFKINTPRLSNLVLDDARGSNIDVIAPQLEHLTVIRCSIRSLSATPQLSTLYYKGYDLPLWFKNRFQSLNKVTFCLSLYDSSYPYKEEDARRMINLLQEIHSAKFLTLNFDIVECISSFPDLVSLNPSPFSNLICLNIESGTREYYRVKMSLEARNFLLENSPNATFTMELPEQEEPTKAMKAKEAREKKRAKLVADIETHMTELQALLQQQTTRAERNQAIEKAKTIHGNLIAELQQVVIQNEPENIQTKKEVAGLNAQIVTSFKVMINLIKQTLNDTSVVSSKNSLVRSMLDKLPKRQKTVMESRYSAQLQEIESLYADLFSTCENVIAYIEETTRNFQDVKSDELQLPLASQPSTSSAATGC